MKVKNELSSLVVQDVCWYVVSTREGMWSSQDENIVNFLMEGMQTNINGKNRF